MRKGGVHLKGRLRAAAAGQTTPFLTASTCHCLQNVLSSDLCSFILGGPSTAAPQRLTVGDVIQWARQHLLTERPELFVKGDTVRPGVLVLVNDCDWELRQVYREGGGGDGLRVRQGGGVCVKGGS